ncbi:MAG: acyltransferase [Kiritimatiellia bacterium]
MNSFRLWIYHLIIKNLPETRFFALKVRLLRWCGAEIGSNVRISSSVLFLGTGRLTIGNDVWIGSGCFFSTVGKAEIKIGSYIDFGPYVMILTGSHHIEPNENHIGGLGTAQSVVVEEGCWIGARATILPGVSLASKTIVAAGAVVTRSSLECKTLIAGVPATLKKKY